MGDSFIVSVLNWWFRAFVFGVLSLIAGMVFFVRYQIQSGHLTPAYYTYVAIIGVAFLLGTVYLDGLVKKAPEQVEAFLRRAGFFKS